MSNCKESLQGTNVEARKASERCFTTFITTFNNYVTHGCPGEILTGAVHGLLILSLDYSWLQALEDRGLDTNVDLKTVSD